MKQRLEIKLLIIVGLIVLLLIPIFMIQTLISERADLKESVQLEIAKSSSGEQQIIGPFIYVEYSEDVMVDDKKEQHHYNLVLLPNSLNLTTDLTTFEKYRGIYKALLYRSNNQLTGDFDVSSLDALKDKDITSINLIMSISDIRGIGAGTEIRLDNQVHELIPGTQMYQLPEGVRIKLDYQTLMEKKTLPYNIDLKLQGMRELAIVPIGKETLVEMSADWGHPSFVGDYLPVHSAISEQKFEAKWETNYFATNLQDLFNNCISRQENDCYQVRTRSLGVNLVDGVDHYLKTYRASNYALLVLVLVFSSFFLLEVLRGEPVHPVQYGFVGLALAVFYLLLISLSEHLNFTIAYLISALGSSLLLSTYIAGMLKNTKHGGIFLVGILFLYSLLYGLLSSENYALLMGSLLIFAVLGIIMTLTRGVNWYTQKQVTDHNAEEEK